MDKLIEQYKKSKKTRLDTRTKSTPNAFKPKLSEKDYRRGFIERRFAQKVNDNLSPITEISESGFGKMSINPLYRATSLKWRISGTKQEIKDSNRASISEQLKLIPQLKNRLVNLIEYCNDFDSPKGDKKRKNRKDRRKRIRNSRR
tara:strand:+ start:271 stop:708 length:438 start_codon:yes stop_codon:yes gene_type:complete